MLVDRRGGSGGWVDKGETWCKGLLGAVQKYSELCANFLVKWLGNRLFHLKNCFSIRQEVIRSQLPSLEIHEPSALVSKWICQEGLRLQACPELQELPSF